MSASPPSLWAPSGAFALSLFTSALALAGPVDTDKPRGHRDEEGLSADANTSVSLSRGNVDRTQFQLAGSLSWRQHWRVAPSTRAAPSTPRPPWLRQQLLLLGDSQLVVNDGARVRNRSFAFGRWVRMWHPRAGTTTFGQIEYDERRALQRRALLGLGAQLIWIHRARLRVRSVTSYMAEFERNTITVAGDPHPVAPINHRLSAVFAVDLGIIEDDALLLRSATYVQPRLDDPRDFRVLQSAQLEGSITPNFAMGLDGSVEWDSQPPLGIERLDWALSSYIRVSFGP